MCSDVQIRQEKAVEMSIGCMIQNMVVMNRLKGSLNVVKGNIFLIHYILISIFYGFKYEDDLMIWYIDSWLSNSIWCCWGNKCISWVKLYDS